VHDVGLHAFRGGSDTYGDRSKHMVLGSQNWRNQALGFNNLQLGRNRVFGQAVFARASRLHAVDENPATVVIADQVEYQKEISTGSQA